jgi:hypothetical protein
MKSVNMKPSKEPNIVRVINAIQDFAGLLPMNNFMAYMPWVMFNTNSPNAASKSKALEARPRTEISENAFSRVGTFKEAAITAAQIM